MNHSFRQHNTYRKETNDNPTCSSQTISGRCVYQATGPSITGNGPFIFTDTDFLRCSSSGNGSAIYSSKSGASLTVERCRFDLCNCGSFSGGAIYANSLSLLSVKNSFFSSCGGNHEAFQGGAISIESVLNMLIRDDFFLKCYSCENAGAIDLRNSGSEQHGFPIQSSSFICCECFLWTSPTGGAFEARTNQCGYFSSVLFTSCRADYGGAIYLLYTSSISGNYVIQFCFFCNNSVPTFKYGNDVAAENFSPTNNKTFMQQCLSTSSSKRLAFYDNRWDGTDVDWLPSGTANSHKRLDTF